METQNEDCRILVSGGVDPCKMIYLGGGKIPTGFWPTKPEMQRGQHLFENNCLRVAYPASPLWFGDSCLCEWVGANCKQLSHVNPLDEVSPFFLVVLGSELLHLLSSYLRGNSGHFPAVALGTKHPPFYPVSLGTKLTQFCQKDSSSETPVIFSQ